MASPAQVYVIEIKATPEKVWEAVTSPDWTRRYFHDTAIRSDWRKGSRVVYELPDGSVATDGEVLDVDWPYRLVTTWQFMYDPEMARETPSRVTWEIEDLGGSCRLTVTHDRLEAAPKTESVVKGGWSAILDGLRRELEAA